MSEINTVDMMGELSFVQISDSHMGFNKPANPGRRGNAKSSRGTRSTDWRLHLNSCCTRAILAHLSKPERVRYRRPNSEGREAERRFLRAGRTRRAQ